MKKYRMSKYKPWLRDEQDRYLINEWTSYSDIGNLYEGRILTNDEYEYIENKYIQGIKIILKEKGINKLVINNLEKNFTIDEINSLLNCSNLNLEETEKILFNTINNGRELSIINVDAILKLLLRECIWCRLMDSKNTFIVEIGYDFYMYIYCDNISKNTLNEINMLQVYIEEMECKM
jgi:hypothetical protein